MAKGKGISPLSLCRIVTIFYHETRLSSRIYVPTPIPHIRSPFSGAGPGPPNCSRRERQPITSIFPALPICCFPRSLCTSSLWDGVETVISVTQPKISSPPPTQSYSSLRASFKIPPLLACRSSPAHLSHPRHRMVGTGCIIELTPGNSLLPPCLR